MRYITPFGDDDPCRLVAKNHGVDSGNMNLVKLAMANTAAELFDDNLIGTGVWQKRFDNGQRPFLLRQYGYTGWCWHNGYLLAEKILLKILKKQTAAVKTFWRWLSFLLDRVI
jgi:hypothetical protein